MSISKPITRSTKNFSGEIERLRHEIQSADAIVIGAGAGLSVSAGFSYGGARFRRYFSDFEEKYGFTDMYSGGFYPYSMPEERWAYWSRYIYINRYLDAPVPVYQALLDIVRQKDYFVITTNVDHCFQKAGFDRNRLFDTQGDFGLFQCSVPCCDETLENQRWIMQMIEQQQNMRIPSELLPICPRCGEPLMPNLRSDDRFVENEGWHAAAERYRDFLNARRGWHLLFLELGVGDNTPGIIKYPFWQMTARNRKAIYACINDGQAICPGEIQEKCICIHADIGEVLGLLKV